MKYYSEDHEWVEVNGDSAVIGISEYAVSEMGEVTYVELAVEDDDFTVGDVIGVVETERSSFDVYSPISGTVVNINEALVDDPSLLVRSPEDKGWLCTLNNIDVSELDDMMNEIAYAKYLDTIS
ncbi:MAG: glycine cleavage system protein H [Victivallaceae bacterium]